METDDWIVNKLYGGSKTDKKLTDPELTQFLEELGQLGAGQLAGEPSRLSDEKFLLQEETENLAFSNYKTFIQAANCSKDIYDDFTLVDKHLDNVITRLPDLGAECRSFLQEAQKIGSRRTENSRALKKHTQLLEILEIPQVMDTCVRAGYWEEALELAQYVAKLHRRLNHIALINKIALEVEAHRQQLVEQLVEQLNSTLSLPQCLKVVGYLRRLNLFTDAELRIKFLLARDHWHRAHCRSLLAAIPTEDPYQHISKVMEHSRVHLFDVITQYRAVFVDSDTQPPSMPLSKEELPSNLPAIFHSWLLQKISEFLEILAHDLRRGVGSRLDSVLAQCMYFGLSLGRVGADFRASALPIFEEAALAEFYNPLQSGTKRLLDQMSDDSFLDEKVHSSSHYYAGTTTGGLGESNDSREPPFQLMDWPDLAIYLNAILTGFNNSRLCLPLTLAARIVDALESSLKLVADQLINLAESSYNSWSDEKREKFKMACGLLANKLVPYLNRCLNELLPAQSIANLLGMNLLEFHQECSFVKVSDATKIMLQSYLPEEFNVTVIENMEDYGNRESPISAEEPIQMTVAPAENVEDVSSLDDNVENKELE